MKTVDVDFGTRTATCTVESKKFDSVVALKSLIDAEFPDSVVKTEMN